MRSCFGVTPRSWPTADPSEAPIWTTGPSRPSEPPEPSVTALATVLTRAIMGLIRPPRSCTARITAGTPWPLASRARNQMSGPTTSPPSAGAITIRQAG